MRVNLKPANPLSGPVKIFLGNKRSKDVRNGIKCLLEYFAEMGCQMSLKIHLIHI